MLVPTSDHMIRTSGVEVPVFASDDVCVPGSAQKVICLVW